MELIAIWFSLIAVTLLLILALFLAFIALFGPPFVPTPQKTVDEILKKLKLKQGMMFYDLGCGDGRVVRSAVKNYGVTGIGVDLNPFLIIYCRLVVWLQNIFYHVIPAPRLPAGRQAGIYKNIHFLCQSFFKTKLSDAVIIYMYPVPMVIPKLIKKFEKECQKGTTIVSYCFEIKEWKQKLIEEVIINGKSVFLYRL